MADRRRSPSRRPPLPLSDQPDESLLDLVDSLLDKGVALDGELVLGLADVDLIYLRLGALVAAADRVFEQEPGGGQPRRRRRPRRPAGGPGRAATLPPEPRRAPPDRVADLAPIETTRAAGRPSAGSRPDRPDDMSETSRSVMRLVLTLVEFIRGLLERQALRRVEEGTLSAAETERLGRALMQLDHTVRDLAARHGIDPATLNLDLGPIGRLR